MSGGILQGNTASLQGNILNNAAVNFDQASTGTYAGTMSGSGAPAKVNGAGTLTLGGTNTYTGGTTVSGGILQGDTTSLQGNILNNAAVIFDQASAGTYAGNMSGSGALTKDGAGTLILTGTNTYSGGTTVSGGTLQGNTTSLQGDILNNAAVIFDQAQRRHLRRQHVGQRQPRPSRRRRRHPPGNNTYTGGTTVRAGTLSAKRAACRATS